MSSIKRRIKELRNAIAYSRNEEKIMSIGEGICCNLEIASWFRVLDGENNEPKYVISDIVNEKVALINRCILRESWERPEIF